MERHRQRIEADHNGNAEAAEWESMETVLGLFIREHGLRDCAGAYSVPLTELEQWWQSRQPRRAKGLSMRIYTEAASRRTVAMRIRRGWDAMQAEATPVATPQARATLAASARWSNPCR